MLDRTHRFRRASKVAALLIGVVTLAGCGTKSANNGQSALHPAGPYARQILDLTRPFFWIAVAIGLGVIGGTIYVALRFREKPGEERAPKQIHGNTVLEMSWTIIPAVILAVMAVPTVATIFSLAKKPTGNVVNVTVSARQWWWQFTYTDAGNGVVTANELHIPVHTPVNLTLQGPPACAPTPCYANGVIHSFWVPALNGKKDVVPGRTSFLKLEADKPGEFLGQCAEYCGLSHADMRLRVFAQTREDYDAWVRSQIAQKQSVAALEKGVDNSTWGCATCHSFQSKLPGAVAPNLAHLADRTTFAGAIYKMNYDNLWQWIHNAPSRKPMGNLQQHMPNFSAGPNGMSQQEAQKIACFLLTNTATNPTPQPECAGK